MRKHKDSQGFAVYRGGHFDPWMAQEERDRLGISAEARRCIEATSECYTACTETLTYSLNGGAPLFDMRSLRLLIDCCEVCQTTQDSLLRTSEVGTMLASVCAEACEKVAECMRELDGSDDRFITCAEVCENTAECCRALALV
jgi:hypothetical protein